MRDSTAQLQALSTGPKTKIQDHFEKARSLTEWVLGSGADTEHLLSVPYLFQLVTQKQTLGLVNNKDRERKGGRKRNVRVAHEWFQAMSNLLPLGGDTQCPARPEED